jgi:hypothetical protein
VNNANVLAQTPGGLDGLGFNDLRQSVSKLGVHIGFFTLLLRLADKCTQKRLLQHTRMTSRVGNQSSRHEKYPKNVTVDFKRLKVNI